MTWRPSLPTPRSRPRSIPPQADLLVKFYLADGEDVGHFINEKVHPIAGIKDTYTIITFRAF